MTELRKSITVLSGAAAVYFGYLALTVPMLVMTGPLVLALVCVGAAYLAWPKHHPR